MRQHDTSLTPSLTNTLFLKQFVQRHLASLLVGIAVVVGTGILLAIRFNLFTFSYKKPDGFIPSSQVVEPYLDRKEIEPNNFDLDNLFNENSLKIKEASPSPSINQIVI
jgi:hypothetical protein